MVPEVYILFSTQEEEEKRCTLLPEGTDAHIHQYIHQNDLDLCPPLYHYDKVIVELEKNTNKEFNCV